MISRTEMDCEFIKVGHGKQTRQPSLRGFDLWSKSRTGQGGRSGGEGTFSESVVTGKEGPLFHGGEAIKMIYPIGASSSAHAETGALSRVRSGITRLLGNRADW